MSEHRTIHDPFLGKDVQISDNLTDRLRGKYACGPTLPNGEPEFGWRQFDTPPIQHLAADRIDALVKALENVRRIIAEGALTGFNYKDGDWAERLFESQQVTSAALASIKERA